MGFYYLEKHDLSIIYIFINMFQSCGINGIVYTTIYRITNDKRVHMGIQTIYVDK